MTRDRITISAFVLSLLFHLALFSSCFSISYLKPEQEMVIEMAFIEIEPPPPVEEVVIEEEEPPQIEPETPPPDPESEPEPVPEPVSAPEPEPISEEPVPLPEVKEVKDVTLARDAASSHPVLARAPSPSPQPAEEAAALRAKKAQENFLILIRRKIERAKYYPRWSRQKGFEGIVRVEFIIGDGGDVKDAKIVEPSGCKMLDEAALTTIKRAAPFSGLPKELGEGLKITIPISYRLIEE